MRAVLYIGINTPGSTSRMRAEKIREILNDRKMEIIDTDIPTESRSRLWRSLGFRYKIGPVIPMVNNYVIDHLKEKEYDLIWVDKAIYLTKETTEKLRSRAKVLVHFTPDPAFAFHRSRFFFQSLPYYDYAITTKSYEIDEYAKALGAGDRVIYATQGYDRQLHRPVHDFKEKNGVSFVGHWEKEREQTVKSILNAGIEVKLAGIKWDKFVRKNQSPYLHYFGEGVFGEQYVDVISGSLFSLGSVSKWIPEKHTTRTFEIPACGTALLTEWNDEIGGFYREDEVIYYNNDKELVEKLQYYIGHKDLLEKLTQKGLEKVRSGGFDYKSIIKKVLDTVI